MGGGEGQCLVRGMFWVFILPPLSCLILLLWSTGGYTWRFDSYFIYSFFSPIRSLMETLAVCNLISGLTIS